jgi:hypothetical protein
MSDLSALLLLRLARWLDCSNEGGPMTGSREAGSRGKRKPLPVNYPAEAEVVSI